MAATQRQKLDSKFLKERYVELNAKKAAEEAKEKARAQQREQKKAKFRAMKIHIASDDDPLDKTVFERNRKDRPARVDRKVRSALRWKSDTTTDETSSRKTSETTSETKTDISTEESIGGKPAQNLDRGQRTHRKRAERRKKKTPESLDTSMDNSVESSTDKDYETVAKPIPDATSDSEVEKEERERAGGTIGKGVPPEILEMKRPELARQILSIAQGERIFEKSALSTAENEALALFFAGKLSYHDKVLQLMDCAFDRAILIISPRDNFAKDPVTLEILKDRIKLKNTMMETLLNNPNLLPETWKAKCRAVQEQHRKEAAAVNLYSVFFRYPQQIEFNQSVDQVTGLPVVTKQRSLFWGALFGPADSKTFEQTAQIEKAHQKTFSPFFFQ